MKEVNIAFKDLRSAVVALNEWPETPKKIKLVGSDKDTILKEFKSVMDKIEDVNGKFPGPKVALNFFNALMDAEEKAEKADQKDEKAAAKGKAPKAEKPAKVKTPKAAKPKKEKEDKGPGVIGTILEIIKKEGPISREDVLKSLTKAFPDRDPEKMAKTVQVQIGGKKHPCRMEAEKGVTFKFDKEGRYSLAKK